MENQTPDNISVDDAHSVNDVQNKSVDDKTGSPEKRKGKPKVFSLLQLLHWNF